MTEIRLTLSVEEVNLVLNALTNRPYGEVYQLIGKIQTEGEKQLRAEQPILTNVENKV